MAHQHDHAKDGHLGHTHGPGGHVHAPTNFGAAFAIGIGLNSAFVIVEAIFGVASNSMALVADAGHNLSDVLGLVVAWVAAFSRSAPPSARFTYGLRGSSILAALFNAVFLLVTVGAIGWEAIQRLLHPEPVGGITVMIVAAVGIRGQWLYGVAVCFRPQGRSSIFAAPICTWRPTLRSRSGSWSPACYIVHRLDMA